MRPGSSISDLAARFHGWWAPILLVLALAAARLEAATVTMVTTDAIGESSWTSGAHWSDGLPPSAGNTYVVPVGFTLRTPDGVSNPAAFAGDGI
jgi:hypothetical protein